MERKRKKKKNIPCGVAQKLAITTTEVESAFLKQIVVTQLKPPESVHCILYAGNLITFSKACYFPKREHTSKIC